jgi:hypothetical protein
MMIVKRDLNGRIKIARVIIARIVRKTMNMTVYEALIKFRADPTSFVHELKFAPNGFELASKMIENMLPTEIEQFMRLLIH